MVLNSQWYGFNIVEHKVLDLIHRCWH